MRYNLLYYKNNMYCVRIFLRIPSNANLVFSQVLSGSSDTPHTLAQCWNATVITLFDAMVDASRWVKRMAVEKERQAYGLPPLELAEDEMQVSASLKLRFGNLSERFWKGNSKEDELEDSDTIEPDSAEYYGTKPGSVITEQEEEDEQVKENEEAEEEDTMNLQSLEAPEFELDVLITVPTIESALTSILEHGYSNIEKTDIKCQDSNISKENNIPENKETDVRTEIIREGETTTICCQCFRTNVPLTEQSNLVDHPPCTRPECPFYVKPEETPQEGNAMEQNTN